MHKVLHEAFEAKAAERADSIAVNLAETSLTYRELDSRANQLAARLRSFGAGPEVPVALYLDRSLEMVVAILGVLKAGGCYVPIDLAYPKERVAFMLEDAGASILLTQEKLAASLPAKPATVLRIDTDWPDIATHSPASQPSGANGSNAAYIIYTSGSTGKPKGVVVTHHNVLRLLSQTDHWYGFNENDVWPLFHSYAFDVSVWELWASLLHGGRLVIVPYLTSRSPADFYQLLECERVTVLNQTPSAFRQLIWAETQAQRRLDLNLRYVICAGEALELQSLKPWFERHGDQRPVVVNMYGITETTVHSTYRPITMQDLASGAGSVIGVPIPDLQIHLVDDQLKPVARGTAGEICVGGDGVARGYLNRDDLTARRFLPDPFSSQPGARIYRSGDLARVSEQGELEYLGRMDHQVKIRGFRVELGDIESALNRHPGVRESVVLARDEAEGEKRLVAYIVPVGGAPTVTELREHLRPIIPEYMTPARFVILTALPLTANGKVDRRALPAPDDTRPEMESQYTPPRGGGERKLATIWSAVLGVAKVGVLDNFFELGGDSIRSIAILSRAEEQGIKLSLRQMFQHPTVAGMAACAAASEAPEEKLHTSPFSLVSAADRERMPADVEDAYPVTRLQLGMFFHNELNPESAIYHDIFSYRIESPFDREKLSDALSHLIQRHPILRTSFHLAGFGEPLQLVHRQARFRLTVDDLREAGEAAQNQALAEWIENEKRAPFDRTTAPLIRFHVQWRRAQAFQFIISFHHSCMDGWSLAAVLTEIFRDYAALRRAEAQEIIPPPRATCRDFAALERQSCASETVRHFWSEKLTGANMPMVPRWPKSMCAGGREQARGPEIQVEAEVLQGLKEMARRAGVPLKTVLLAAHQRVMSLLYGQPEVVSGLLCNGRPEAVDGEKVIGLFLNTLPLRLSMAGGTWLDLVRQCFAAEQEIAPHRRFPLAEIQKLNGGRPVFEAAFDFVQFHVYNEMPGGIDFRDGAYFEANDLTAFTTFMLDASGKQLEFHIDYDPNRLCRRQIEEMSAYYAKTVRAIALEPEGRYEAFSPMPPEERERTLVEWNKTAADYPGAAIHELFEQRAAEDPQKIALVSENETWTYRDLNRRANDVARKLAALGAGEGTLAGICMTRTAEMVAGLLGILKTGAAYVPLDPAFPRERLAFMLADAKMQILVTENRALRALPDTEANIVCVDALDHEDSDDNGSFRSQPDSLAYVMYTSGSTGKPKGVQVAHGAVVNLLASAGKSIAFEPGDKLLSVTTLSFDIAGLEIFLPLISGGRLILAPHEIVIDGPRLAALIDSSHATVMQATPATWRLLIESGWTGRKSLRVLCGGEALTRGLADALLARTGELWNFYGPTETTIWSTAWKVDPEAPIAIGRPLANTQLHILDSQLQPVPVGVAGELHIGGHGLARGYLGRPDLTAEKFIPNPFSNEASLLYKTGDWARYQPDGTVECLGRIDQQVKIRGFRIELGEIETALRQHPSVAHALVVPREDSSGEKRLVGYLTTRNGPPPVAELREFIRSKLPAYMAPSHFVMMKEFPLMPNGKIDARQLPAPEEMAAGLRDYAAPRDEHEQALAEVWQEVLSLKRIGVNDDFFELGADSLSATRAFARINRRFGINLPLRAIFENPTVARLAAEVLKAGPAAAAGPSITRRRTRAVKLVS
ncbi:MAG TPA: amino acid adenylation domain-containing protein [Verrucomicrobiae bacterium]